MQDPLAAAAATTFLANPTIAMAVEPTGEQPQLKCPRCDSTNTKFCYYNNYNLSQPRHFCKNCRRYWTKGGALRNIPVGGGTRKNSKRSSSSSSSTTESSNPKRPTPDPYPLLKPEPVSAIYPPPPPPPPLIEAADDKMLEITGSFSSLLQSTGQFGNLNFLDVFESPGGGDGSGAVSGSDSGEPNRSGENPNPDRQSQQPAENFLGWAGGWPDLAIYTSPGSSFQ